MVTYKSLCEEFTKHCGFRVVKQLLVTGLSGRNYLVVDDVGIRTLRCLFSKEFNIVNLFVIDASELKVFAQNIAHHTEIFFIDFDVAYECEHTLGRSDKEKTDDSESDFTNLEGISKERKRVVADRQSKPGTDVVINISRDALEEDCLCFKSGMKNVNVDNGPCDQEVFSLSDDHAMSKKIPDTHSPNGHEVDVNVILQVIEQIFQHTFRGIDGVLQVHISYYNRHISSTHKLNHISDLLTRALLSTHPIYVGKSSNKDRVRRINSIIRKENLCYCLDDVMSVWYFWTRLESMFQLGQTIKDDKIMQEVLTMLSFDASDRGWALSLAEDHLRWPEPN
ncbi:hypothetical protein K7X08_025854 [Anisodus acutangulus]|uniref:Uncharacterized protein n=1 Tax=Anisodus acutangulus TaxID=402998 RepID=A0A9Q1LBD7_9SOLA|nr:hypothetical protein K7X08_025854 [Anisodus acutangulus]